MGDSHAESPYITHDLKALSYSQGRDIMRRVTSWGIALLLLAGTLSVAFAATPGRERGATSQVRIDGFDPLVPASCGTVLTGFGDFSPSCFDSDGAEDGDDCTSM